MLSGHPQLFAEALCSGFHLARRGSRRCHVAAVTFLPVLMAAKQLGCDDVSDAFRYGVGPKLPIGITQNGSSSI